MDTPKTDFPLDGAETDKTCETCGINNDEFLQTVFGGDHDDAHPIVVSFKGNPNKVASKDWFGWPWKCETDSSNDLPTDSNNYFSLATFAANEAGCFRRQKSCFHALHAVVLDDVGTKVARERLTCRPSWLLETSPGNFQAGYLLRQPLLDGNPADRLMKAIIEAKLCDPGAGGPQARLARLPVGVNGKHIPPRPCRMITWSPSLRYSVEELVDGLRLDKVQLGRPKRPSARPVQPRPSDGDPILIPCPTVNEVLAVLKDRGHYKAPLGNGKHDIRCPWVHEHTDGIDHGTVYFEPDDNWPIGGFKCQHGHCAERQIRDLLEFLDIEISAARMVPTIRIIAGEIHHILAAAEGELAKTGRYYQRGGLIVTVLTDPGTHEARIQEIRKGTLVRALASVAIWERYDGRTEDWIRCDPPSRHAGLLFDSSSYPHLPVLNGLARQPYLRPDGSLMTTSGYDPASGMFGVFNAAEFSIPESPTRADAKAALASLMNLLEEFGFATKVDMAAALMAILTAVIRPSLAHAPMFHVRANTVGSGKSYLCQFITAFATPQQGTPTAFPGDDDECRKLLLAELLHAPAVIEFDNLNRDLAAHKSLCTALTSEHMSGRILGVSKTASVNTRVLFLSSGNNVGPINDMTRRCITIHLDPECEVPASRTFKRPNLVRDILRERAHYVSEALTIIRAWIVAGKPKAACQALAGYDDWSDLCRQPLLYLGLPDPMRSVFEAMENDPDREALSRLLVLWQLEFGNTPAMVRDAIKRSRGANEDFRELLCEIAGDRGEINPRKLGWWIKRHAGRIVDGRHIVRSIGNRPAEAWQINSVAPVSLVSPVCSDPSRRSVRDSPGSS